MLWPTTGLSPMNFNAAGSTSASGGQETRSASRSPVSRLIRTGRARPGLTKALNRSIVLRFNQPDFHNLVRIWIQPGRLQITGDKLVEHLFTRLPDQTF